jgi:carboxynorspermidine decarboxylase
MTVSTLLRQLGDNLTTPAFIYDENEIKTKLGKIRKIQDCNILYPLKPCAIAGILHLMAPLIHGFSASSLFEAMLAKDVRENTNVIHLTSPGLRPDEIETASELCDYISFNSLSQLKLFNTKLKSGIKQGLRINPQISFVEDDRYDPCRKHSKLGVPLTELLLELNDKNLMKNISGLLFHTNAESTDFNDLLETVKHIEIFLPNILKKISWINLGGGYLFEECENTEVLTEAISLLKSKYELEIFFEPGKGIIGDAGYLVSSVIDLFKSDNRNVAILDTTVNHMPEVFEYQYQPDIDGESCNGKYKYILAGSSCLAGDIFGEYKFDQPLTIGSKVVFKSMGAYTLVKANMFNGINLPSIYAYTLEGKIVLKRKFGYNDFLSRWR